MRKALFALLVLGFVVSCTGCEMFAMHRDYAKLQKIETGSSPILRFFKDRFLDFIDWFPLTCIKLQAGEGFLIHGRVTKLAQFGMGYFKGVKVGCKGREWGYWEEIREELGISLIYINNSHKTPLICNVFMLDAEKRASRMAKTDLDPWRNDDRHWASCGVNIFVGFVGIDIDIRVKEIFDFIIGLLTLNLIDISQDDTVSRLMLKQSEFRTEAEATEIIPR